MSDIFGDSQRQFHNTFSQTYGHLYERNAFIFRDYFQELRKYYERGNENLFETTNRLFTKLYQKMFQVSFYMNKYYINEILFGCEFIFFECIMNIALIFRS